MQTVDLKVSFLKAAAVVMAKRDIRYYLNGVLIEVLPRAVRIVATDGHRLACFHSDLALQDGEKDLTPAQIIIPGEVLKGIKARAKLAVVSLQFDESDPLAVCRLIGCEGADRVFRPIDGKYPDYSKVLPNTAPTGVNANFNPHHLADFAEACRIALDRKPGDQNSFPNIFHNGDRGAAVTHPSLPEFCGVLVPMAWRKMEWEFPRWITQTPTQKAA